MAVEVTGLSLRRRSPSRESEACAESNRCIVASFAIFTVSMSSLSYFLCFSFSSQSSNFLFSTGPPFLVVGFAEEDEVDEDDEVGGGRGGVLAPKTANEPSDHSQSRVASTKLKLLSYGSP